MKIDLSGKRALVCGASSGLGAAIAQVMAECGAELILLARSQEKLEKLNQNLGGKHQIIAQDIADLPELKKALFSHLKKSPIHIVINNSGGPKSGPLLEGNPEDFALAFQQHILAAQAIAQQCLPGMKSEKYGRFINVISTSVKTPLANLGVSNTIRGAMASWAKTLANEVGAYGITVNNILPGYTVTDRLMELKKSAAGRMNVAESDIEKQWKASIPLGRFGEPQEFANAAAFLASPLASYISGINLPVDGGRTPAL